MPTPPERADSGYCGTIPIPGIGKSLVKHPRAIPFRRIWRLVMSIEWNPSAGPTLGVEWEVQLIDSQTRLLRQDASAVLAGLPGLQESGEHPKMRHELMQSTVEVVTGICGTVAEAKADLAVTMKDLQLTAEPHGIVLAAAGTHPLSDWRDAKMAPVQRYSELVEQLQWTARRLQTMATHVHV